MYTVIGATAGAVLSFLVARHLGKNIAHHKGKGNLAKIQHQLDRNGFYYVLMLRFIPLINFDLISYCSGISKVRFRSFFFGTLIGIIPGTFAYNFLGSSFVDSNPTVIVTAIVVFIFLSVVPILVKRWLSHKSNLDLPGNDGK
ncbi:TVP38/TMEM64 family protein [Pseudalkalibacillus decolorationis]|uniref:TVP38/TMEM64 family protein n=1 Tax=Pseudalkalibacillus decolorationis TaxID=163879 RepID=UPI0027E22262|nr:VTT domain-containing protein [Pseudalkalibacillus decolorationis]